MVLNRHAPKNLNKPHPPSLFTLFNKPRHIVVGFVGTSQDSGSVERLIKKAMRKAA